jgi:hypothetical protein
LSEDLLVSRIRAAIRIRRDATHKDSVPSPDHCAEGVDTFSHIWHALSRHFVNLESAVSLGEAILARNRVEAVCLYGSLARGSDDPNDIDLLVLDDGTYTSDTTLGMYADDGFRPVETTAEALAALNLDSPKNWQSQFARAFAASLASAKPPPQISDPS